MERFDGDGFGDELDGINADLCPDIPGVENGNDGNGGQGGIGCPYVDKTIQMETACTIP